MSATDNKATIERLYEAFGDLEGEEVGAMWRDADRATDLKIELREHETGSGHLVALLPPLRSKARAKALDQLASFRMEETGSSI